MAQAEGRHLSGAGEEAGVTEDRDRADAAKERAGTDRDRLRLAADAYVADFIASLYAPNESIDPIVRQARSKPHARFDELGVDFVVDVHRGSARWLMTRDDMKGATCRQAASLA